MSGVPPSDPIAALALTLTPGLGCVRARRLLERFGSPADVLRASPAAMAEVEGIGPATARKAAGGFAHAVRRASDELEQLEAIGGALTGWGDAGYPGLLSPLPDAPVVLTHRGSLACLGGYPVAIVGSREPTHYGIEQAERFASALATAGLTVVSGGARGIDAAAHRAAMAAGGRTVVVLGSGLGVPYPAEHADLYDQIAASGRGAVVSELPVRTQPAPANFPARNRIISGLSLGVLVIEAGRKSGALITGRLATETHGRECMAVPGRIDSPASAGCNELIKAGGAALVTEPADVVAALESAARFAHADLHAERYRPEATGANGANGSLWTPQPDPADSAAIDQAGIDSAARAVYGALDEPRTPDELAERLEMAIVELRSAVTTLDLAGLIRREGTRIARRKI